MNNSLPSDERKIWWIASYPKSGSTWVRMFLNAYVTGFPIDINSAFQYATGDLNQFHLQLVSARPVNKLTATEQFCYRSAVLLNLISTSTSANITLKTHNAKVTADGFTLIPVALSKAALYIVRDPRDVAISYADHLNVSVDECIEKMNDMMHIAEHKDSHMLHVLTTWSTHINSWVEGNANVPTTVVRYEDMVDNSEGTFRVILKALGFDSVDETKFKFALDETKFSNLQRYEKRGGFVERGAGEKFFRVGKHGQWKTKLKKNQIETIVSNHGEVMAKFNYEV